MGALALGLIAATPRIAAAQTEGGRTVHAVVIRGNEQVPDDDILDRLASHPPEGVVIVRRYPYDPIAVAADRERIRRLYRERGFFSARVEQVHVVELGAGRVGLRFDVVEGAPARIGTREILGVPDEFDPTERLELALSRIEEGDIFRHENYVDARQRLLRALHERGYAHASVSGTVRVERQSARAVVRLRAIPGPQVRYGDVSVSGLSRVPESAVLNRVAWNPGEIFSPRKMETTQGRLYELGQFSSVRLDFPSEGKPEVIDVEVRATEGARRELQLGGGVAVDNTYLEVRGVGGYLVRSIVDPLLSMRLAARPAYQLQRADTERRSLGGEASVTFERIDLGLPLARGTAQVAARSRELETYDARGGFTRLTWGVPMFGQRLDFRAGWELRPFFEIVNLHPALENPTDPAAAEVVDALGVDVSPYRLGFFHETVVVDLRDSILAPTKGALLSIRLEQGGRLAGGRSALTYATATGELRGYVPVGERLVLAARGRLGNTLAGELPITQRYLAGGASSHRGFGHRRLSPTLAAQETEDFDGDRVARIGGSALLETSYEVRTRVKRIGDEWLGVTVFADAGDVTLGLSDIDPLDLHWALGAGLRYNTIIGPVRFDVGYRITSLNGARVDGPGGPVEDDRLVFHFSLGEAF